MAPEFPPRLVVFNLTVDGNTIAAHNENIEPVASETLRVRWADFEAPPGYRSVASGALFVQESADVRFDGLRRVQLVELDNLRFRWTQGTPPEVPWLMIAVIFPEGHTFRRPNSAPTAAKTFNGRVAAYWCLKGNDLGRAQLEFTVHQVDRPLEQEIRFLNSTSSLDELPAASRIEVETTAPKARGHQLRVFLCHASQDKPQVRELYARLRESGFKPWLDQEDILPGEEWEGAIRNAVRSSQAVLVCLSHESVTKVGFLQREISFVLQLAEEQPEGALFVIPMRLDNTAVPSRLSKWQWLNYFEEGAYNRLLRVLDKRTSQLRPA